jgi:hypothetical protein
MKKSFITALILLSVSFGCRTTKESTKSTEIIKKDSIVYNLIKKDSIIHIIKQIITPSNNTQINLRNPCDSLGNLKPMDFGTTVGKSKLNIIFKDNEIKIEAINDSIKEIYESKFTYKERQNDTIIKSLKEKNSELVKITKKSSFNWWFLASILLNILFIFIVIRFFLQNSKFF